MDGDASAIADVTLTAPVGTAVDDRGSVWIADTGGNRLVVVDESFERVLARVGTPGTAPGAFDLPFRLAHHPDERWLYVTDMGNGRVQRLAYAYEGGRPTVTDVTTFGPDGGLHPNGIAIADYPDGVRVFVADEFHSTGDDLRGRIVVFDETGRRRNAFRAVERDGTEVPFYWPQGLAVDGTLYVANTGYGVLHEEFGAPTKFAAVVRCDREGRAVDFTGRAAPTLDDLPMPRDVAVVEGDSRWVVVPDAATGRLRVYDEAGIEEGTVPSDHPGDVDGHCPDEGLGRPDGGAEQFAGPVAVTASGEPSGTDWRAQSPASLVITETLDHAVGRYTLEPERPAVEGHCRLDSTRDAPGTLSFAAGVVMTADADGNPVAWVADGANGRLQHTGPGFDEPLRPVDLPATHFPFGLAVWPPAEGRDTSAADEPAGAGAGRLFVTDYTTAYREREAPQVHVYAYETAADLTHVASFGEWGVGEGDLRLPRGVAVAPLDDHRARVYVADSGNGRVDVREYDRASDTAAAEGDLGNFGHADGMFWNPSDVAVGDHGVYVADENNNRLQRFTDGEWTVLGGPGYGDDELLLPVSVAAHDGTLFVVDLVKRRLAAFDEPTDGSGLQLRETVGTLGGSRADGALWMPYLVSAAPAPDATADASLLVPDASLNAAYRYTWTGE